MAPMFRRKEEKQMREAKESTQKRPEHTAQKRKIELTRNNIRNNTRPFIFKVCFTDYTSHTEEPHPQT